MTTSGASAVTTTGSHCQLADSRCWIRGVFILCILSFYSSEMDNVFRQQMENSKWHWGLSSASDRLWQGLSQTMHCSPQGGDASQAPPLASRRSRRSLSPTISTWSEDVWNLACFGNDSQKVRPVTILFFFLIILYFVLLFPNSFHELLTWRALSLILYIYCTSYLTCSGSRKDFDQDLATTHFLFTSVLPSSSRSRRSFFSFPSVHRMYDIIFNRTRYE